MSAPAHAPHDHGRCMRQTLATADSLARRRGLRFTAMRRRVLEIIAASHRPMGAYDILDVLGEAPGETSGKMGRKPAPPTVYRALEFLLREGFVHRIDTLNAYIACFAPERRHRTHFLLCTDCGCVAEIEDAALDRALERAADAAGFAVARETVEIAGLCAACAGAPGRSSTPPPRA